MRSKSSPPSQTSMTRWTASASSNASRSLTTLACAGSDRMMATSRRTSSTSTLLRSFRLLIDLHASRSPVTASRHRRVTPNSPRPSSSPISYRRSISSAAITPPLPLLPLLPSTVAGSFDITARAASDTEETVERHRMLAAPITRLPPRVCGAVELPQRRRLSAPDGRDTQQLPILFLFFDLLLLLLHRRRRCRATANVRRRSRRRNCCGRTNDRTNERTSARAPEGGR
ncbi:Os12g0230166 [Oryza sativa Japonica Group]|uniref:Os12g0230166 protein n=1 Tax=Oryza sativa subsp. japonica TaxID=39947 RepID=C7J9N8_ORYSJ|nr:Os12g0230166 [Oryza sativa Japonica Group]|eukprot:NP_001176852.1 Os12g0230166 [Oryza sativa Japonica Group]